MVLRVDVLADGGIRVAAPGAEPGMASLRMATDWMRVGSDRGWSVVLNGDAGSPAAKVIIAAANSANVPVETDREPPERWPKDWTSMQMAASSGLQEQVEDLLQRGVSPRTGRRDESPYRLAMRGGHVGVLGALRNAGAPVPSGSRPPGDLPGAVVFRNYLPTFIWWFAAAAAAAGLVLAVVAWHWAFLLVAGFGAAAILVGNLVIGLTRIAIDGPRVSVRHVVRWQGPIDLRELVALGYTQSFSRRMSSRWRLVQHIAGPAFGPSANEGFERPLVDELKAQEPRPRVVTLYCGRGFLTPGFERHLAAHVRGTPARVSTNAQSAFGELGIQTS